MSRVKGKLKGTHSTGIWSYNSSYFTAAQLDVSSPIIVRPPQILNQRRQQISCSDCRKTLDVVSLLNVPCAETAEAFC